MTPQLQQAIRLLQLSTMELHAEVQDALDSNLMLEPVEDESDDVSVAEEDNVSPVDIPNELPVDSVWEDIYDSGPVLHGVGDSAFAEFENQRSNPETLKDHLYWQMSVLRFSDTDRLIGAAILDAIDDDGYVIVPLEDIRQSVLAQALEITIEEVEACLRQVQNFDPPGVAARDLRECLNIQLLQYPVDTPWRSEAIDIVLQRMDLLAAKDYVELMKETGLEKEELAAVVRLIRSLTPRPGALIQSSAPEFVIPDVFVRKIKGVWRVELNPEAFPKVRVNNQYLGLIKRSDNSADNNTLKAHLQEARWFIKSLRSRSETLLKVATSIVERQTTFLEHGDEAMKPMVLHDIAEVVEMHESTISRVTNQKYMHTPRGIYELKYFFSSHVYMLSGAECSSTAIRALLKKLIAAENPGKPLSDSKLANILSEQGVSVARRTVAKYREAMSIPASSDRRALV